MTGQDWKSVNDSAGRLGGVPHLVANACADQGVRNALQGAFTCSKDMPEEFDKMLARLR